MAFEEVSFLVVFFFFRFLFLFFCVGVSKAIFMEDILTYETSIVQAGLLSRPTETLE